MQQPELGLKILQLRKRKGLTQEELVQQCNINVRTIQRIEAGEVTPRSYTIRTILDALDADYEEIASMTNIENNIRQFMMLDFKDTNSVKSLINSLNIAMIAGIVYFLLSFLEFTADYYRFSENELIFNEGVYVTIKIVSVILFTMFFRGYIATGTLFKNHLLRVTAFTMLFANIIAHIYDLTTLYIPFDDVQFSLTTKMFCFGTIGILLGISLLKLGKPLGLIASLAGWFEIVTGFFTVTIILAFVGLIFLNGAEICGIIMLYKVMELIKEKQEEVAMGEIS